MHRALDDYKIIGLRHNIPFHKKIMEQEQFLSSDYGTDFIELHSEQLFTNKYYRDTVSTHDLFNFAVIELLLEKDQTRKAAGNPWLIPDNFRVNYTSTTDFEFEDGKQQKYKVKTYFKDGKHYILTEQNPVPVTFERINKNEVRIDTGSVIYFLQFVADKQTIQIVDN